MKAPDSSWQSLGYVRSDMRKVLYRSANAALDRTCSNFILDEVEEDVETEVLQYLAISRTLKEKRR